jgi:hypothetical protein
MQQHLLFCFAVRTGFERRREKALRLSEENSPVDCFRRRGNERSEARERGSARKNPSSATKKERSRRFVLFLVAELTKSAFGGINRLYADEITFVMKSCFAGLRSRI